jgi:predicted enzyme related to lactoylglutathione lyase
VFTDAFPILHTPDLNRALGFYAGLLDAQVEYRFPSEGDPAYVALRIGTGQLGIALDSRTATGAGGQRVALWVYTDSCDVAIERLRAGGARITAEPADMPWGERMARALDPDGNEVILGERA